MKPPLIGTKVPKDDAELLELMAASVELLAAAKAAPVADPTAPLADPLPSNVIDLALERRKRRPRA